MAEKGKEKVLFVCTGNCCRSQMAQGWARYLKADGIEAYSAGTFPGPEISSRAVAVMAEAGVDISMQRPKHISELSSVEFDYVITLCDNAKQSCPTFPAGVKVIHQPFEDPSFLPGTDEEVMSAFRRTREQIRDFVESFPDILESD